MPLVGNPNHLGSARLPKETQAASAPAVSVPVLLVPSVNYSALLVIAGPLILVFLALTILHKCLLDYAQYTKFY